MKAASLLLLSIQSHHTSLPNLYTLIAARMYAKSIMTITSSAADTLTMVTVILPLSSLPLTYLFSSLTWVFLGGFFVPFVQVAGAGLPLPDGPEALLPNLPEGEIVANE